MQEKILLVDDEPAVLQGYQRLFRNEFQIDTAPGGQAALHTIQTNGPYAVVVSDMRMPNMDGLQFLRRVKSIAPDTIRIMLTGDAGIETAVNAVNEGNIFRFLSKPCNKMTLGKTLTASLLQYRLTTAERDLLEETLKASIQVLTEVLSLVSPAAFSRATRLRRYMAHIVKTLKLNNGWRFEVAAMMSQLGCLILSPETIEAVYNGEELSREAQARFNSHPLVARSLLENIPRMEPIAWMIAHQDQPVSVESDIADREMADMRLGAELLHATLSFDSLVRKGMSRTDAGSRLSRVQKGLDPRVVQALVEVEPELSEMEIRSCAIDELSSGMVLHEDVRTENGTLIAANGHEVTEPLILKLKNFYAKNSIGGSITVRMPKQSA